MFVSKRALSDGFCHRGALTLCFHYVGFKRTMKDTLVTLPLPSGEMSSLHCTLPSMCSVWQWCRLQMNQSSLILAYINWHIPLAHTPLFLCQQLKAAMCLRTFHPKTHMIHTHSSLSDLIRHSENDTTGYFLLICETCRKSVMTWHFKVLFLLPPLSLWLCFVCL